MSEETRFSITYYVKITRRKGTKLYLKTKFNYGNRRYITGTYNILQQQQIYYKIIIYITATVDML